MLYYARVLEPVGILSQEASSWRIQNRYALRMWETLSLNGVEVIVTAMNLHTEKGELIYEYELSRREGLRREKEENPQIFGMSLPATVKERSGNRIRVQFDIDPVYEATEKNKYFTYAIESSSFYCMPEEGSRVQVYFPEHEEQSAIAVHAISSESGGASASKNPAQKQFSDPSGNAMDMAEATLDFVADAEGTTSLHMDKGGYLSLKGMDITLKTPLGMMSGKKHPVKSLMICGEQKLIMQVGDSEEDNITMEAGLDLL